jgi:hypothetical protein
VGPKEARIGLVAADPSSWRCLLETPPAYRLVARGDVALESGDHLSKNVAGLFRREPQRLEGQALVARGVLPRPLEPVAGHGLAVE